MMKPVYSQLSTNEAVVRLRSDLMLSVAPATDLLTFTNKEIDYYLDLHYFGARYYHSTFPRFISPDPVSGNPMNPISWNRYLYCRNDPINAIDPDGEDLIYVLDRYAMGGDRETGKEGQGHSAAISGPVDGQWRYESFGKGGDRQGIHYFNSEAAAMQFAADHNYTDWAKWKTTEKQDRAAQKEADTWHEGNVKNGNYKRHKNYFVTNDNCAQLVNAMFNAAGLTGYSYIMHVAGHPKKNFDDNSQLATAGTGTFQTTEQMSSDKKETQ
jgi:RHS repeat-associated protein